MKPPAFRFGAHCELEITAYRDAVLSVPSLDQGLPLHGKDLLAVGEVASDGKYTLEQHLEHLTASEKINPDNPLLVLGVRNNLVNLRCPVSYNGEAYAIEGEQPSLSQRPYYGIGFRQNRFECGLLLGGQSQPNEWNFFCAGIPVLWDDLGEPELFDRMLAETADHSHLFELPRGNHPSATDITRQAWQNLNRTFTEHLYSDMQTASQAMRETAAQYDPPLSRSAEYFHALLGVRNDGGLVCLFAQGRLEGLGDTLRQRGCRRAICVENSGSVMPTFLPKGIRGETIPLVRAPNFRPKGRAIIVITLEHIGFTNLPFT